MQQHHYKRHSYKLDPTLVPALAQRRVNTSIRYGDDRRLVPGDRIIFTDPADASYLCLVDVETVAHARICHVPGLLGGTNYTHHTETADELLDALRGYYPEAGLTDASMVRVIGFEFGYRYNHGDTQ